MERLSHKLPAVAWVYGILGLIPFVGCAGADIAGVAPNQDWWRLALLMYGAIILSFLGGARWGLELARVRASATAITLSMAPSLAGFFLLLTPPHMRRWALCGAAVAHGLQWLWDYQSKRTPQGYGRLRSALAAGAIISLSAAVAFG